MAVAGVSLMASARRGDQIGNRDGARETVCSVMTSEHRLHVQGPAQGHL